MFISPTIKTRYNLSLRLPPLIFPITRIEGGSSMKVNDTSGSADPVLEIYLSSEQKKRECALVTDFPKQLLEALKVRPFDAANELHQYLEVPLESLNMLLVRKGIIGEIPSSPASSDSSKSDEMSDNEDQSQRRAPLVTPEQSSSVTSLATPPTELSRLLAPLAAQSVPSTQSPRDPEPISRTLGVETSLSNSVSPSDFTIALGRPEEEPPIEPVTTAGIYSTSNRSRNREILELFAHSLPNQNGSRGETTHSVDNLIEAAFDMTQLQSALEDSQASVVSAASVSVRSAGRPRGRHIPDRSQEDRARDFEIGFLGEHYVSDPVTCPIRRRELTNLASRPSRFYVTSSGCPISVVKTIGRAHCEPVPDSPPATTTFPTLPTQTQRETLPATSNRCGFHTRDHLGLTQSSATATNQHISSK